MAGNPGQVITTTLQEAAGIAAVDVGFAEVQKADATPANGQPSPQNSNTTSTPVLAVEALTTAAVVLPLEMRLMDALPAQMPQPVAFSSPGNQFSSVANLNQTATLPNSPPMLMANVATEQHPVPALLDAPAPAAGTAPTLANGQPLTREQKIQQMAFLHNVPMNDFVKSANRLADQSPALFDNLHQTTLNAAKNPANLTANGTLNPAARSGVMASATQSAFGQPVRVNAAMGNVLHSMGPANQPVANTNGPQPPAPKPGKKTEDPRQKAEGTKPPDPAKGPQQRYGDIKAGDTILNGQAVIQFKTETPNPTNPEQTTVQSFTAPKPVPNGTPTGREPNPLPTQAMRGAHKQNLTPAVPTQVTENAPPPPAATPASQAPSTPAASPAGQSFVSAGMAGGKTVGHLSMGIS